MFYDKEINTSDLPEVVVGATVSPFGPIALETVLGATSTIPGYS
jgi:hypothetical protein